MELKNKTIVITGGTKGLGLAMAMGFMKEEANVVVCSRNESEFENIPSGIVPVKADVTREEELENVLNVAKDKFGSVDIWINNAGIWLPHDFTEDFDMNKVRMMFDINTFGSMNGSRVAIRYMKRNNGGVIVNIISDSAIESRPMSSMYASSKWAMNGYTKSIREENVGIKVIAIYPGPIQTGIFGDHKPENYNDFMDPNFVADMIINNLRLNNPEEGLIIKRP
jgi:NAD(P)-dependent dehydrogenase (short-subunit alcohol dehydrogenase family)